MSATPSEPFTHIFRTPISYGNASGIYFSQFLFDQLAQLLESIENGQYPFRRLPIEDVKIWYDSKEDFHYLSFQCRGRAVEVRVYRVFACRIDGKDFWVGCPISGELNLALAIRRELGVALSAAEN